MSMPPAVFDYAEAQALQGHRLIATQAFKDVCDRGLIPETYLARVIGIAAWQEDDGTEAITGREVTGYGDARAWYQGRGRI
jgi:hypothetical protein